MIDFRYSGGTICMDFGDNVTIGYFNG